MSSIVKTVMRMPTRKRRPRQQQRVVTTVVGAAKRRPRRPRLVRMSNASNFMQTNVPRRTPGLTDTGKEFVVCSLDPFGADSARVPDGNGGMSTHVKYTASCTFKVRSGQSTACVAAFPALPAGLICIDGNFTVASMTGTLTTLDVIPGGDNVLVPFPDLYDTDVTASAGDVQANIGARISRARVVSFGLEVNPTGALLNQGGVYATARFPTNISEATVPMMFDAGTHVGVTIAGGGALLTKHMTDIPQSYSELQTYPGVKMCSGTEACRLVGTPSGYCYSPMEPGTLQWGSTSAGGQTLVTDMTTLVNAPLLLASMGTTGNPLVIGGTNNAIGAPITLPVTAMIPKTTDLAAYSTFWYDRCSDGVIWAAQGLTADMTYTARFHLCVEMQVDHRVSLYRPFISQAPMRDDRAMAITDEVHRQLPPSVPSPDSHSNWWSNLTQVVSGIGDFTSLLGIPVVSQVGALASRFARLLG